MTAPLTLTTKAGNGGQPLTGDQIDANWAAIMAFAVQVFGAVIPNFTVADSADGNGIDLYVNGQVAGTFSKPPRPINPRGPWVPATPYAAGDTYTYKGNTLYVRLGHTSTTVAADAAAGRVEVMAAAGQPGYTPRGNFDPGFQYALADGVTVGADPTMWVLTIAAPAGTAPPAPGQNSAYWTKGTIPALLPSTAVTDATYGLLSAALGSIETALGQLTAAGQSLSSRVTALESKTTH